MKKHFFQIISSFGIFLFAACSDSTSSETAIEKKNDIKTETKSTSIQTVDSVKKTSISIGPEGVNVKSENTDVQVNKSGVNVGTKDVKVDVKSGK